MRGPSSPLPALYWVNSAWKYCAVDRRNIRNDQRQIDWIVKGVWMIGCRPTIERKIVVGRGRAGFGFEDELREFALVIVAAAITPAAKRANELMVTGAIVCQFIECTKPGGWPSAKMVRPPSAVLNIPPNMSRASLPGLSGLAGRYDGSLSDVPQIKGGWECLRIDGQRDCRAIFVTPTTLVIVTAYVPDCVNWTFVKLRMALVAPDKFVPLKTHW